MVITSLVTCVAATENRTTPTKRTAENLMVITSLVTYVAATENRTTPTEEQEETLV